jgi:cystathionine beta-lyase/cystathionine gamma-synthase
MKLETILIHAGQKPDRSTGSVTTPIFQTSTYAQDGVGRPRGYEYSRTGNPTRTALEACLAALEGGEFGLAFSSGMAATDAILRILDPGDHVIAGNDVYGGTFRLFESEFRRYGLVFTYVDTSQPELVQTALRPQTRLIWLETPSNPLLEVTDIAAVSELLKDRQAPPLLVVDNTFATPYLQRPLQMGADLIVHSTTKYLGGHSDVIGGALITDRVDLKERLAFLQNAVGAVPGPMDCYLVLRGVKTLAVRMARHSENAGEIASYLSKHRNVDRVRFPFDRSHPQYEVARKQMRNGGGMVSFTVRGGEAAAVQVAESTEIFTLAESLGAVESLIEVPAAMTHLSTSASQLAVDPALIRLSVGLEHVDDLIADLSRALERI